MKTKEFIKRVEELGFEVWTKLDSKNNYILLRVGDGEDTFAIIWAQYRYALSTMEDGFTHFKGYLPLQKLYKLCFEYASTPVKDREKEEKDKENRPKFRVWDKETKYLDYDVRVTSTDEYEKVEVLDCFSDWIGIEKNNYVIMRNTGLKDENGIEIYEGDLVEYRDGEESFKGEAVINCFGSYVKTESDYIRFEDFSDENTKIAGNCYVVGNIYEDPELLEELEE